jgi:hypothetical protein
VGVQVGIDADHQVNLIDDAHSVLLRFAMLGGGTGLEGTPAAIL